MRQRELHEHLINFLGNDLADQKGEREGVRFPRTNKWRNSEITFNFLVEVRRGAFRAEFGDSFSGTRTGRLAGWLAGGLAGRRASERAKCEQKRSRERDVGGKRVGITKKLNESTEEGASKAARQEKPKSKVNYYSNSLPRCVDGWLAGWLAEACRSLPRKERIRSFISCTSCFLLFSE